MSHTSKFSSVRATILLFWRLCNAHGLQFWLTLMIPISSIAISSVVPLFIGKTLASLQQPAANHLQYLPQILIAAGIGIVANRVGYGCLLSVQAKVLSQIQQLTFDTLLKRGVSFHNNRISGKLVSDANDLQQSFNSLSNVLFISIIPLSVILVSGVVLVSISSWVLGLALLIMSVVTIGTAVLSTLGRSELRARRHRATKQVISHMADTVVNQQTVKTFAKETLELQTHRKLNDTLLNLRLNDWMTASRSNNLRIALLMVFQIIFVVIIVQVTKNNPALLATGIFAFAYTVTLTNRLLEIGPMIRTIEDGFLQSAPMIEVMAEAPEIIDKAQAKKLEASTGTILFDNVKFTYKDSADSPYVFENLNLTVKAGEKVGLIGPSGGGKSTLTRILLRFENIDSGRIMIDGQDISAVTQQSLREYIAYVPQEPLLFHRPIRDNIAYGKADATDTQIIDAAKKAAAHEFIASLPDGYDTIVGERGVKLSGGQRQRVAIARAILKNAPILMLDEATSALDSESESAIQLALRQLMKGKTAIVIAHRLSTIQRMDRIVVMDEGRIIEEGTHQELLDKKGLYAKLWKHQSGGFIEE